MPNLRSFLLVALAFVAFLLWQAWEQDYALPPPAAPVTSSATDAAAPADVPVDDAPAATDVPSSPTAASTPAVTATDAPAVDSVVTVETDVLRVAIETRGGNVVRAELLKYPVAPQHKDQPVRLLSDEPATWYVAQSGLVSATGGAPDHRAAYQAAQSRYRLEDGTESLDVPLTWDDGSGLRVTKILRFTRGAYTIGVSHAVANEGAAPWRGSAYRQLQRLAPPVPSSFSFTNPEAYSFVGASWYSPEERFESLGFDEFAEEPLKRDITDGWAAMLQHYFVAAWIPPRGETNAYSTEVLGGTGAPRYLVRQVGPAVEVAPGSRGTLDATLYVGPKLQERLPEVAPGLEYTVDYGMVTVIAQPLFWLLSWLHKLLGNWGWAIVMITVLVKLALYPLSEAQYRSMAKMRKMQPRLAALKERYGEDRQKLNQAMMELYQKEKINPMGGCLPLLVQIPVFIALYWVLLESVELRQAPFIGWIQNLSDKDPYFVLPILNGITMFAAQKLSPATGMDPTQQKIMQMMPVVFGVMFAFFPAGLVLYWTVNGVLGLAQQWVITKRVEAGTVK